MSRRLSVVLAGTTAAVLRIMVDEPDREWTVAELGVDSADVRRPLAHLRALGLVAVDERAVVSGGSVALVDHYRLTAGGRREGPSWLPPVATVVRTGVPERAGSR
ncbi:hypothetical protein [Rhizohabitans arisaemae]|uniref:hypothetical protein n=1 Tax=Rhizohabitans arisaemae TaxID=2720610 RepID=UPI0024B049F7|nr:hypothetical protein [Rhizohabitans arisaemae]